MPVHRTTFDVAATPDAARAWVADPANLERWHPLYRDVAVGDDGVRATIDFYGQAIDMAVTVDAGHRPDGPVRLTGASRRMRFEDRLTVEPHGTASSVTYEVEMTAAGALRPFNRGLMPVVERGVARGAKRLAKVLTRA